MGLLYFHHEDCALHDMGSSHPECPQRLAAIEAAVTDLSWSKELNRQTAPELERHHIDGVHERAYLDAVWDAHPAEGELFRIDADTAMNSHSLRAARLAAGAGVTAVDQIMDGKSLRAFCAVRPPGHHAETPIGMGFCIFNSIALAADHALARGAQRVAILDFDVHHGNGTVEIFKDRPEVLVCSSFQFPFYPGRFDQIQRDNICHTPLPEGTEGPSFRQAITESWGPALANHQPDIILISAGFDAHREDPLGGLMLEDDDYSWITQFIVDQADTLCGGRVLSMLEGGYNLDALGRSVCRHLEALR